MISMEPKHLRIVQLILSQYPYDFYVFGSRACKEPKPLSDLDLCYLGTMPTRDLLRLKEQFLDSDLPYKVNLVDWSQCDPYFQDFILKNIAKISCD